MINGLEIATQGLLLGLSNGVTCLATCAPVLIPLFLGEAESPRGNALLLVEFLGGRLTGYLLFGITAWVTGRLLLGSSSLGPTATGLITLCLGALMLGHGAIKASGIKLPLRGSSSAHAQCAVSPWRARTWLRRTPRLIPTGLGLFSGLNLCPPFVVALTQGAVNTSLTGGLLFFACFFAGTSLFFLPTPFLGAFRNTKALVPVGYFSAILVGLYYLYSGALHLLPAFVK